MKSWLRIILFTLLSLFGLVVLSMLIAYGIMATHGKAQLKNEEIVSDYEPHAHHEQRGIENSLLSTTSPAEPKIGDIQLGQGDSKANTKLEYNLDDIDERLDLHKSLYKVLQVVKILVFRVHVHSRSGRVHPLLNL